MATKTITLELDAYEYLKRSKRGKESFSEVVRRARFEPEPSTGEAILEMTRELYAKGQGVDKKVMDYWDRHSVGKSRPLSANPWDA